MSVKAARGTKRVCQSCGSKFYDLNRAPITCPICQAVNKANVPAPRAAAAGNHVEDDDEAVPASRIGGIEFVPLEQADAGTEDIPEIEDEEFVAVAEDEAEIEPAGDDEAFLEEEDEGEADVSGFIGGGGAPRQKEEEA